MKNNPGGRARFPLPDPRGETTSHSTKLQETAAKSLVIPQAGEGDKDSLREFHAKKVAVVGGGPAGLMAAEVLIQGGVRVDLYDAMPTVGRKFLRAGKGGMNITHAEPLRSEELLAIEP